MPILIGVADALPLDAVATAAAAATTAITATTSSPSRARCLICPPFPFVSDVSCEPGQSDPSVRDLQVLSVPSPSPPFPRTPSSRSPRSNQQGQPALLARTRAPARGSAHP